MKLSLKALASAAVIVTAFLTSPAPSYAEDKALANWIQQFKAEATQKGIAPDLLNRAFVDMEVNTRIIELDRKQPEGTMTFAQYMDRVVSQKRINEGRRMLAQHKPLLEKVAAKYGVQPRFIVALWGIETNYGDNTGGFSVIEALATLAYEGRRADFFRSELLKALQIINEGHISLEQMKGSWAGAMGQCQFMPSSFIAYAQDYDGDGHKDIWNTQEDVFASIANYLAKSGWDDDLTWGREVKVPNGYDRSKSGRENFKSLKEWQTTGIRDLSGGNLPTRDLQAALVFPDDGPRAFLVYKNYNTIMKWNRSTYFAIAVGMLSDALTGR